jgi:hypothetical protein
MEGASSSGSLNIQDGYGFVLAQTKWTDKDFTAVIPDNLGDRAFAALCIYDEEALLPAAARAVTTTSQGASDATARLADRICETLWRRGTKSAIDVLDAIDLASANVAACALSSLCEIAVRMSIHHGREKYRHARGDIGFFRPTRDTLLIDFRDKETLSQFTATLDDVGKVKRIGVIEAGTPAPRGAQANPAIDIVVARGDPMTVDLRAAPTRLHLYRLTDILDRFRAALISGGVVSHEYIYGPEANIATGPEAGPTAQPTPPW